MARQLRITYLVRVASGLWGGVKSVLEDANLLTALGHRVTIVSTTPPPSWIELRCGYRQVEELVPAAVPASDLVIATTVDTVEAAIAASGVAVHYVQGYEGADDQWAELRPQIEALFARPETHKIAISPHLVAFLAGRFGVRARLVRYAIDHEVMFPGPLRARAGAVRVGLVGPYEIGYKGIRDGMMACELASRAGLELEVVRITNTRVQAEEGMFSVPVERHERVAPSAMGDLYRSLDVFLGTSKNPVEGFFLPAVEAMACGVPCVLTDIAAHRGYGDGEYALFAAPGDVRELAIAMARVLREPGLAERLAREAIRVAGRYRQDEHVRELEAALLAVASGTEAPGAGLVLPPASL